MTWNGRVQPDEATDEWQTLSQRLDFLRATVVMKADGLTDNDAFGRSIDGAVGQ